MIRSINIFLMFSSRGKSTKKSPNTPPPPGFPITKVRGDEDDFEQVPMSVFETILESLSTFRTEVKDNMKMIDRRLSAVENSPSRGGGGGYWRGGG